LIRLITWQWLLGHGPWCSGRALARWLGVSHTYIQKLTQTLSRNESDFLREVAYSGLPTIEGLRRAREESRQQRERGLLRTQRRWKTVEYEIGDTVVSDFVSTKPNGAILVANNPFLPEAPKAGNPPPRKNRLQRHAHVEPQNERGTGESNDALESATKDAMASRHWFSSGLVDFANGDRRTWAKVRTLKLTFPRNSGMHELQKTAAWPQGFIVTTLMPLARWIDFVDLSAVISSSAWATTAHAAWIASMPDIPVLPPSSIASSSSSLLLGTWVTLLSKNSS
jgi:hypothetical protein